MPARGLNDLRARLDWMGWWNLREITPDADSERVRLATLRADIERMGARLRDQDAEPAPVQSGHYQGTGIEQPSPVQSGHPRRTNADKRRDVLALLDDDNPAVAGLTDREIARRVGVSPTTVGTIRRALA